MQQRKQYLIDRKFQMRLALELMVVVLIVPLVVWADFYVLGQYALSQNIAGGMARSDWGIIGSLIRHQWLLMAVLYLVNFGLIYLFLVFYTHRIAGPVYRFTTILDAMTRGDLGDRIKLRKNDYFENLGVSINGLADHYTDVFTELKAVAALIDENKSEAASSDVNEQIGKMNSILDRYQLDK
jgi:methyl-accepting chemotaxis protein